MSFSVGGALRVSLGEALQPGSQSWRDPGLVHAEYDDPVVRELSGIHCRFEAQAVELRPIDRLVAHVDDFDFSPRHSALRLLGVDARRRRHVEPLVRHVAARRRGRVGSPPSRSFGSVPPWSGEPRRRRSERTAPCRGPSGPRRPASAIGKCRRRPWCPGRLSSFAAISSGFETTGHSSSEIWMSSCSFLPPAYGSEQTTRELSGLAVWVSHSRRAWETSAMVGARNRIDSPSATNRSAIRSAVKVLPVPQAMMSRPRS